MTGDIFRLRSRGDLLAEHLKGAILRGEFRPGDELVERQLAVQFGVSKTPVREALRTLASSRLTVARGYKAVIVQPLTPEVVDDVFQMRLQLEPWAAAQAIHRIQARQLSEIKATFHKAQEASGERDLLAASTANRSFHRLIYSHSGNELLTDVLDQLQDLMAFISVNLWKFRSAWQDESQEHSAIIAAIDNKDSEAVRNHMSVHIARSQDRVADMLATMPQRSETPVKQAKDRQPA
jgi:DNA-binding GntR family transcriptional regulator